MLRLFVLGVTIEGSSAVQCSAVLATRDQTKAQAKGKKFKIWFSPKFLGLIKLVTHADLRQIVDSID